METPDTSQQVDNSMNVSRSIASLNSGEPNGETGLNTPKCHQPVLKQSTNSEPQGPYRPEDSDASKLEGHHDGDTATTTSQNVSSQESIPDVTSKMPNDETDTEEIDNSSDTSEFFDFSEESWHPVQGPIAWVQGQMRHGHSPRKILEDLVPGGMLIPDGLDPIMLWKIIINIVSEPPRRKKLDHVNTLDDVMDLLRTSKKIMVLTGAGVSVSCGIPDFRSRDGVYARLSVDFPNLPDPQAMFDIHFFQNDPRPFFKFAKEIYPGQFQPSPCHHFIRLLESKGKILRNYTQNIDTLEQVAGIQKVIQCHGSFATATCTECGLKVNSDVIKDDIFKQVIPLCSKCPRDNERAVMKPDIVFFGESLPEDFHNQMAADKDECDLLIVIGSSLKVRPVALIPNSLPPHVPQILINRERLHYLKFDVELLGNCDDIVGDLCRRLGEGWEQLAACGPPLKEVDLSSLPTPPVSPQHEDSCTSLPMEKPHETKSPSENNNVQPSETSHREHPHPSGVQNCVDSSNPELKLDTLHQNQTTTSNAAASSPAEANCSFHSSCARQSDLTHKSCKTGSINCGITPHHKQDVMFCPSKGAPHSLTKQQIAKCSSDASQTSSCGHCHHHTSHHHSEKRKSESCDEESEPRVKHPKLDVGTEHANEPSVSSEAADSKSPESLEMNYSIDEIRKMWKSKRRISLAQRLSDDQVLFLPPCRYVFKGAEVFSDCDDDDDDSDESSSVDICEDEEEDQDSGEPSARKESSKGEEHEESSEGEEQMDNSEGKEQAESQEDAEVPHSTTAQLLTNSETTQPSASVTEVAREESSS